MNHEIRSEQFNEALEKGTATGEFQALLDVAAQLRHLPDPAFKIRLRAEIEGKTKMTYTTTLREGFRAVTPWLMVRDPRALIDFLERAFSAVTVTRIEGPQGLHAEMRIGDSMLMIGGGERLPERSTAAIHLYVADADSVYMQAVEAGGKSLGAVENRPYGERSGFVEDPSGNHWYIGTPLSGSAVPEGKVTANPYMHAQNPRALMGFLKRAFGAEEIACHEMGGRVMHAEVRIGDSILEMGEADFGPSTFYVYVDDPDAAYRNALAAGATSAGEPVDQPYGERNAKVVDPFGNTWFPARTITGHR